jgi:hypothetical protein
VCGWLYAAGNGTSPVWVRRHVILTSCPKSYITGESMVLLEKFNLLKRFGPIDPSELTAREADAFAVLDHELFVEMRDGERDRSGRF